MGIQAERLLVRDVRFGRAGDDRRVEPEQERPQGRHDGADQEFSAAATLLEGAVSLVVREVGMHGSVSPVVGTSRSAFRPAPFGARVYAACCSRYWVAGWRQGGGTLFRSRWHEISVRDLPTFGRTVQQVAGAGVAAMCAVPGMLSDSSFRTADTAVARAA